MLKKLLVALSMSLLVFSSSNALAFKWGVKTKITGYFVYAGGGAYINAELKEAPEAACTNTTYLALDTTAPGFKELYSTILAAYVSGQTVSLNYDGCVGTSPKIIGIAVPGIW